MSDGSIHRAFLSALDALVEQVKDDRSILAAVLCGSLSHDAVWAKSDIDLVLVTVDDRKVDRSDVALYADGINVHAFLMPRAEFRRTVEGARHSSFPHSFLAKGRLLYTHDPTIADLCMRLSELGARDLRLERMRAGIRALGSIDKARKWLITRGDLEYASLWILYAATSLAQVEVLGAGLLMDREVIPQASRLNPAFFRIVYADLLNTPKTRADVEAALEAIDGYLSARAPELFAPAIEYLREAGEARAAGDIEFHFTRTHDVEGVTVACEYLADRRLIGKASLPVRLTKRSNVSMQELAFFHAPEPRHAR
jgi:predicted nucleotidyltransferase